MEPRVKSESRGAARRQSPADQRRAAPADVPRKVTNSHTKLTAVLSRGEEGLGGEVDPFELEKGKIRIDLLHLAYLHASGTEEFSVGGHFSEFCKRK